MSTFWKVRLATLTWGFLVSLAFTGHLWEAGSMFATMAIGNSIIMWLLVKN